MNTDQIAECLKDFYQGFRIIFWNDPDQEFTDIVDSLGLEDVTVIKVDEIGHLELKVRLEFEEPGSKFLLYSTKPKPEPEADWLLDIRLYSKTFSADRASILLGELGLVNQSMRPYLAERKKFFSKDRLARLKKWVTPADTERDLDKKMVAVLTKAEQASNYDILMKLFGEMCDDQVCEIKTPPKVWDEIEKFGLAPFFWEEMARSFGYAESSPAIPDLLIRLLVTDLAHALNGEAPAAFNHFALSNKVLNTNVSVFMSQWRSHLGYYKKYVALAGAVSKELKVLEHLSSYDHIALLDAMTFEACEQQAIRSLRDELISGQLEKPEDLRPIIQRRRDGHWATIQIEGHTDGSNTYRASYEALSASLDLLSLRKQYDAGLSFSSPEKLVQDYQGSLYCFDQHYRLFHEAADKVEASGLDVLKGLQKVVEACYNNWFMDQLSVASGSLLGGPDGLLRTWSIDGLPSQQSFYVNSVKSILGQNDRSRVFVVISDALRYEVAEELSRDINTKSRFKATLEAQLGVLPSYTALGMAALLPRNSSYGFKEGTDQVLVDGQPCSSLEQRNTILGKFKGMAVKADDLLAMSKDEGRELISQKRVIYIYHNQIDAVGDAAQTENKTFAAARKTIDELSALVRYIINALNGTNVLVTADHGFIYQDTQPTSADKSELEFKPDGIIKGKKRFILGTKLGTPDKAWNGTTKVTAGTSDNMEFLIPKGFNRFHFSGGAKFIHGGAMPQEVIVPIIRVQELDSKEAEKTSVTKVGVSLLGSSRKIVNNIQKFEFIQTEKVTERTLPRVLAIGLRDGDTLISNEETVTFDSSSDSMDERKRSVKFMLKKGNYDSKKEYFLTLRDPASQIEFERIPMTIDLAFGNDF